MNITLFPYFKNGDDFSAYLERTKNVSDALVEWGRHLAKTGQDIQQIGRLIANNNEVTADADTHMSILYDLDEDVGGYILENFSFTSEDVFGDEDDIDDEGETHVS